MYLSVEQAKIELDTEEVVNISSLCTFEFLVQISWSWRDILSLSFCGNYLMMVDCSLTKE